MTFCSKDACFSGRCTMSVSLQWSLIWIQIYCTSLRSCVVSAQNGKSYFARRTVGTAVTFLRRFYLTKDLSDFSPCLVASACMYLACKVEETHVKGAFFHKPVKIPLPSEPSYLHGSKLNCNLRVHSLWHKTVSKSTGVRNLASTYT